MKATITWWSHKDAVEVRDAFELDRVLDAVIESECKEHPTVLEIQANGYRFMAVGLEESFVQMSSESGLASYLVAVSDKNAADDDTFTFFFQGLHDTEIRRRYILPATFARELARSFVTTGKFPQGVTWEEL